MYNKSAKCHLNYHQIGGSCALEYATALQGLIWCLFYPYDFY